MSFQLSPFGNQQFFDSNGNLAVGFKLFTYLAGTSTKEQVAKDVAGAAFHTNPIVLNAFGLPASPIFIDSQKFYKFVYAPPTDTDPPVSPVYTADYVAVTPFPALTIDQWVAGTVPTFISGTQFSVAGDQAATYAVGRRVKLTNSSPASTAYGTITVVSFGAGVTTVTVEFDSGSSINASLSAVAYGLLQGQQGSVPVKLPTDLSSKKPNPALRLIGQEVNGKDYLIQEIGGVLKSFINTGTEAVPVWTEDNFFVPTGTELPYAGSVAPAGYLLEDGTAHSRVTQARLFYVIGITYGAGDGSTTFNVPDKRGRTSIGSGTGSGLTNRVQGTKLGEENHAQTLAENGPHDHSYSAPANGAETGAGAGGIFAVSSTGATTGASGSGTGHNTMQPSEVDLWIIKT